MQTERGCSMFSYDPEIPSPLVGPAYGVLPGECLVPFLPVYLDMAGTFAIVDRIDWEWAKEFTWGKKKSQRTTGHRYEVYAYRTVWLNGVHFSEYLHVEITKRIYGPRPSPKHVADHLNGNRLDCRRMNLQWKTKRQNRANVTGSRVRQRYLDAQG